MFGDGVVPVNTLFSLGTGKFSADNRQGGQRRSLSRVLPLRSKKARLRATTRNDGIKFTQEDISNELT